jgi:hypothetical protein
MKKQKLKSKLNVNKMVVASLDFKQMNAIVAGGPKRSIRLEGECHYSRNHYSQCTEGERHSKASICVECN